MRVPMFNGLVLASRALHSPQKLGKNGCLGAEWETSVRAAAALSRLARESASSAKHRLRSNYEVPC